MVCPQGSVLLLVAALAAAATPAAPAAPAAGLVYPLYVYPDAAALAGVYTDVVKAAAIAPVTVIVNPDNGEQAACPPNSDWAAAVALLRHPNVTTLGYVHSSYGKRPLAAYRKEIAAYTSCWGVAGIFVDEAASTAAQIPYYTQVAAAVRSFQKNASVWLNPAPQQTVGTSPWPTCSFSSRVRTPRLRSTRLRATSTAPRTHPVAA